MVQQRQRTELFPPFEVIRPAPSALDVDHGVARRYEGVKDGCIPIDGLFLGMDEVLEGFGDRCYAREIRQREVLEDVKTDFGRKVEHGQHLARGLQLNQLDLRVHGDLRQIAFGISLCLLQRPPV